MSSQICALVAVLLVASAAPVAARAATPPPRPQDSVSVGAELGSVPIFGANLAGYCEFDDGGCSVFAVAGSGSPQFRSPIEGKVVAARVAVQSVDEYAAGLQIGAAEAGALAARTTVSLTAVISGGGDRIVTSALDLPAQKGVRILASELVGLVAVGAVGPSLISSPGSMATSFIPALLDGESRAPDPATTTADSSVPLQVVVERTADVQVSSRLYTAGPGARYGDKVTWVVYAWSRGPGAARGVRLVDFNPFSCPIDCRRSVAMLTPNGPAEFTRYRPTLSERLVDHPHRPQRFRTEVEETRTLEPTGGGHGDSSEIRLEILPRDSEEGRTSAPSCGAAQLGTDAEDRLRGSARSDALIGLGADDRLDGRGGGDCISGDDGDDAISGAAGPDSIQGGAGGDDIDAGGGGDRIESGPGSDRIDSRDRRIDWVECGRGRDRVTADRVDRISSDCERVRV